MIAEFKFIGRVGTKPELGHTSNGNQVVNISIATNKKWVTNGQKHEKTSWHRVTVFGNRAGACAQYLEKGSLVYLSGEINENNYEKNGETVYSQEFLARTVQFLSSPRNNQNNNNQNRQQPQNNQQYKQQPQNNQQQGQTNDPFYGAEQFCQDDVPF